MENIANKSTYHIREEVKSDKQVEYKEEWTPVITQVSLHEHVRMTIQEVT